MKNEVLEIDELKKLFVEDLFKKFSSTEKGITETSAKERIGEYGYNEISKKK